MQHANRRHALQLDGPANLKRRLLFYELDFHNLMMTNTDASCLTVTDPIVHGVSPNFDDFVNEDKQTNMQDMNCSRR